MDRLSLLILVFVGCLSVATANNFANSCKKGNGFPKEVCYDPHCATAIKDHIKNEFDAAFKYLYMGSYFAQDYVDRPGLAKFLFEAASEERGHAIQMLDYLNLRGIKYGTDPYNFDTTKLPETLTYQQALEEAINMEIEVTNLIYGVVEKCGQDYHGADVFTNPILDEQHDGVRKLQGAYQTLVDLLKGHEGSGGQAFAEYMFDRKLLNGEL